MASPGQPEDKQARFSGFQALRLLGTSPVGRGGCRPQGAHCSRPWREVAAQGGTALRRLSSHVRGPECDFGSLGFLICKMG